MPLPEDGAGSACLRGTPDQCPRLFQPVETAGKNGRTVSPSGRIAIPWPSYQKMVRTVCDGRSYIIPNVPHCTAGPPPRAWGQPISLARCTSAVTLRLFLTQSPWPPECCSSAGSGPWHRECRRHGDAEAAPAHVPFERHQCSCSSRLLSGFCKRLVYRSEVSRCLPD